MQVNPEYKEKLSKNFEAVEQYKEYLFNEVAHTLEKLEELSSLVKDTSKAIEEFDKSKIIIE